MSSVFKIAILPVLAVVVGFAYWVVNIGGSMFVKKLGCGCGPHFNTNDLTLIASFLLSLPFVLSMLEVRIKLPHHVRIFFRLLLGSLYF